MKHIYASILALIAISLSSHATLYTDLVGDTWLATGSYDIKTVDVSNTDANLSFTINLNFTAATSVRYLVAIDANSAASSQSSPAPWGSALTLPGMDIFLAGAKETGVDQRLWSWSRSDQAWTALEAPAVSSTSDSFTLTLRNSDFGLTPGSTIKFDVYTAAEGPNGPIDALSNGAQIASSWSSMGYNSGSLVSAYTLTAVPEPAHYGLMGAGGLLVVVLVHRRKKGKAE